MTEVNIIYWRGTQQLATSRWRKGLRPEWTTHTCATKSNRVSSWAPFQYPISRLISRSREVWTPQDWQFKLSYRFWNLIGSSAVVLPRCLSNLRAIGFSKYQCRGFETSRVSEWFSLTAFFRTADIEVHIVHTSRVVIAYTLKSLSSLT